MRARGTIALVATMLACVDCQLILGIDPNVPVLDGAVDDASPDDASLDGVGDVRTVDRGSDVTLLDGGSDVTLLDEGSDVTSLDGGKDVDGSRDGGGDCGPGTCMPKVLAHATGNPTDIAIDAQFVFWSSDDGSVGRVGKDGSGQMSIVGGITTPILWVAVDATRVYFATADIVYAVGKDGTGRMAIATGQNDVEGVAANDGVVYWLANTAAQVGAVLSAAIPLDGGAAQLVTLYPNRQYLQFIAVDTQNAFWGENFGTLMQAPLQGADASAPLLLAYCINQTGAMAIDGQNVYWSSIKNSGVFASRKGDQATTCAAPSQVALASNEVNVYGVAAVGGTALWTSQDAGYVKSESATTGCSAPPCGTVLAANQGMPARVVAEPGAVYWIDANNATIDEVGF